MPKARGDDEAAKKIAEQRENLVWALGAWALVLVIAGFTFHFAYRTVGLEADVDADLAEYHKLLRPPTQPMEGDKGQAA